MARPMDLLGKFVQWPNAAELSSGRTAGGGVGEGSHPGQPTTVSIDESVALSLKVFKLPAGPTPAPPGAVTLGAATLWPDTMPLSVNFLKYLDGGITEQRVTGPLMTGAMSGCYTFRYQRGGVEYVSHVGTGGSAAANQAVKEGWVRYIRMAGLVDVKGVDGFYDADVIAQVCSAMPGTPYNKVLTYHYYGGTDVHRLLLAPMSNGVGANYWKVLRVDQLHPLPWSAIKKGDTFQGVSGD